MGNICCRKKKNNRRIVLLLLGLDNAGKTRAANGLAGDCLSSPVPTVGFSVINIKYHEFDVKIFDLGGGANIRGIWNKYFVDAHGLIFVIDSSDYTRFNEVKVVLEEILSSEKISGKPLLVLANKQDHENAMDEIDIIEYMNIEQLVNNRKCPTLVQSCSANETNKNKLDAGIQKGFEWLVSHIKGNYEILNKRVEADVCEQVQKEREEMQEKIRRIKELQGIEKNKSNIDEIETYSDYARKISQENDDGAIVNLDNVISFDQLEILSNKSSDSSSSISFPPVYVNADYAIPDRPKSAVQIVKHQLQMNGVTRQYNLKYRSNKTAPMNLLYSDKLPQSARERRRDFAAVSRRALKSADDRIFTISNKIPNGDVGSSGDHWNAHHHHNSVHVCETESMKLMKINNSVPLVHNGMNGDTVISVVDIN